MLDLGIIDELGGPIKHSEGDRFAVADEKGFSDRTDTLVKAVVPRSLGGKAVAATSTSSWDHISVCSFLPLNPARRLPIGVVVPTKLYHPDFEAVMPGAVVEQHEGGSITTDIWIIFLLECYVTPLRKAGVCGTLGLIADSGGGSFLHLSPAVAAFCIMQDVRIYFLDPYLTRALCALDMQCHGVGGSRWAAFKHEYARTCGNLSLFKAMQAVNDISDEMLSEKYAEVSWRMVGFQLGHPLNRDKVLIDRRAEVGVSHLFMILRSYEGRLWRMHMGNL